MLKEGMVHIYYGEGKGKTSAAIGLGIRAIGRGGRVCMIQFLKSWETGESIALKELEPDFMVIRYESEKGFFNELSQAEIEKLKAEIQEEFAYAKNAIDNVDVLIMDEILGALENKLLPIEQVKEMILSKPKNLELVLTGRELPEELTQLADYISKIENVKHPMEQGKPAREGIEY